VVLVVIIVLVGFLFLFGSGGFLERITGFSVFEQDNRSDFDEGNYNNTEWNGSGVVLSGGNTSGDYTSTVFDAGNDASWNNLTWQGLNQTGSDIYLTSAFHLGVNRTEVFILDGSYYLADMKDSSKGFYLNFSEDLVNGTILKFYAIQINCLPTTI